MKTTESIDHHRIVFSLRRRIKKTEAKIEYDRCSPFLPMLPRDHFRILNRLRRKLFKVLLMYQLTTLDRG